MKKKEYVKFNDSQNKGKIVFARFHGCIGKTNLASTTRLDNGSYFNISQDKLKPIGKNEKKKARELENKLNETLNLQDDKCEKSKEKKGILYGDSLDRLIEERINSFTANHRDKELRFHKTEEIDNLFRPLYSKCYDILMDRWLDIQQNSKEGENREMVDPNNQERIIGEIDEIIGNLVSKEGIEFQTNNIESKKTNRKKKKYPKHKNLEADAYEFIQAFIGFYSIEGNKGGNITLRDIEKYTSGWLDHTSWSGRLKDKDFHKRVESSRLGKLDRDRPIANEIKIILTQTLPGYMKKYIQKAKLASHKKESQKVEKGLLYTKHKEIQSRDSDGKDLLDVLPTTDTGPYSQDSDDCFEEMEKNSD